MLVDRHACSTTEDAGCERDLFETLSICHGNRRISARQQQVFNRLSALAVDGSSARPKGRDDSCRHALTRKRMIIRDNKCQRQRDEGGCFYRQKTKRKKKPPRNGVTRSFGHGLWLSRARFVSLTFVWSRARAWRDDFFTAVQKTGGYRDVIDWILIVRNIEVER